MPKSKSIIFARDHYKILAAAGEPSAEILIYGDIGKDWFGEGVDAQDFAEAIAAVEADYLTVRINSYGGSVTDGLAIYNAIRRHPAAVTVSIDGAAYSIASLIAMAGDTVEMAANALFMVHAPWGVAKGNAQIMREYADVLDLHAAAMASSYAAKTGRPAQEMADLLLDGEDHWYNAHEAQAAGFVDVITEELAAAAALTRTRFHVPAALAAAINPQEKTTMPDKVKQSDPTGAAPNPPADTTNVAEIDKAAQAKAREALKARNAEIEQIFAPFLARGQYADLYQASLKDADLSVDQVRERLLAKLGEGSGPLGADPRIEPGMSERDKFIEAGTQALMARMGAAQHDRANPYRGMRLHELARASLKRVGVNVDGETPEEFAQKALTHGIIRGAQTTSDFPVILENTLHKMVLMGFQAVPLTWNRVAKIGDVTDFRAWNRIVPGLIGNLDGVNEAGEYKNKVIPDGQKNAVQATRKGNIIQITPEVLVNDDLGYVQDMANGLGAAGGRAIERAFYTLLEANPTLSDGVALFHADHGNLASSGAAPTVDLLDSAASAMAQQTAPGDDAEYLDIRPSVAVVNTALRGNMMVLVEAQYDPDTANKLQKPNKVRGIVQDIVATPRIAAAPWYLFADPMVAPVIEVVFLNGQREPRLTMEENFRTSGLAWKVELPFGVGAIDYRGAYKNPGA